MRLTMQKCVVVQVDKFYDKTKQSYTRDTKEF